MLRWNITLNAIAAVTLSLLLPVMPANAAQGGSSRGIEGSWIVTVHVDSPPPGFPERFTALESYARGGSLVTSNNNPIVSRTGQGAWSRDGAGYATVIVFFVLDATGAQTGSIHVRHRIAVDGGDAYTGRGEADFKDLDGNTLVTLSFESDGVRLAP